MISSKQDKVSFSGYILFRDSLRSLRYAQIDLVFKTATENKGRGILNFMGA